MGDEVNVSEFEAKEQIKKTVAEALRDTNANKETVALALEAKLLEFNNTLDDEGRAYVKSESQRIAGILIKGRDAKGVEATITQFDKGADLGYEQKVKGDKIPPGAPGGPGANLPAGKNNIPYGTLTGAAAGVVAGSALGVGDWKSVTGILKKLGLITAGLTVGMLATDDFGVRTQAVNFVTGKKPEGASKA